MNDYYFEISIETNHTPFGLHFDLDRFKQETEKSVEKKHLDLKIITTFMDVLGISCEGSEKFEIATKIIDKALKKIPENIRTRLFSKVEALTEDEKYVFNYLYHRMDLTSEEMQDTFLEILKGGYVQFDDGGATFDDWQLNLKGKKERISSHQSFGKQYSIQGPLVGEDLFSVKEMQDSKTGEIKRYSFFQLERHPTTLRYVLLHLLTWLMYKFTGMNYGPFGRSKHTEHKNPLTIHLRA